MKSVNIKQIQIIHISDIHFGKDNIFNQQMDPDGDTLPSNDQLTAFEMLKKDFNYIDFTRPTIFAITGDMTEEGKVSEYSETKDFINNIIEEINKINQTFTRDNFFIVPGNHDVLYEEDQNPERLNHFVNFLRDFREVFINYINDNNNYAGIELFDRTDDLGTIILSLNSSIYIKKGTKEEDRGVLGWDQLKYITTEISKIDEEKLNNSIKIALIHHHPILIPSFTETGKGYDAIPESATLISTLQEKGFHMILHGHKHNPCIFTTDIRSAYESVEKKQMVIVAGGSYGSKHLQDHKNKTNTYNIIKLCWNSSVNHFRVNIETRGIKKYTEQGTKILQKDWEWETINEFDESYFGYEKFPFSKQIEKIEDNELKNYFEEIIIEVDSTIDSYFPVYELRPSVEIENSYELIIWIEDNNESEVLLEKVFWYPSFSKEIYGINRVNDDSFSMHLNYNQPFIMYSKLIFSNGKEEYKSIYVRIPRN